MHCGAASVCECLENVSNLLEWVLFGQQLRTCVGDAVGVRWWQRWLTRSSFSGDTRQGRGTASNWSWIYLCAGYGVYQLAALSHGRPVSRELLKDGGDDRDEGGTAMLNSRGARRPAAR